MLGLQSRKTCTIHAKLCSTHNNRILDNFYFEGKNITKESVNKTITIGFKF